MMRQLCILIAVGTLAACDGASEEDYAKVQSEVKSLRNDLTVTQRKLAEEEARSKVVSDRFGFLAQKIRGVKARIKTNFGDIETEFFPEKAPGHVKNFVELAEKGFYDGTVFHRIIPGFMIQGGCPQGTGTGGPGYTIDAEFNDTRHVRGVLSMARAQDPNSAGSQFFICHGDASSLDGDYTAFGKLTDGDDTLEKIATGATRPGGENSSPVEPVKVTAVRIVRPS